MNNDGLQMVKNQLLPNDFEKFNFAIPKYHCHLTEIKSYEKLQTNPLSLWYDSSELISNNKFDLINSTNQNIEYIEIPPLKFILYNWYRVSSTKQLVKSNRKVLSNLGLILIKKCNENSAISAKTLQKSIHKFLYSPESNILPKQSKTDFKKIKYPKQKIRLINKDKSGYFKSEELSHVQLIFEKKNIRNIVNLQVTLNI